MSALHPVDIIALIAYMLGITILGAWMSKKIRSTRDFFMPRRFGKAMMITHAFGTGTASDQAVVVAGATFQSGISGIWWQWLWLPVTPFYWIIAPVMRRFRATTTADVLTLRYNHSVAVLYSIIGIAGLSVKTGLLLKGSSALVDSCTGGFVNADLTIGIITVLLLIYGTAGGLGAAILTDFIQGLMTVLFSFLLLPFILNAVGGLEGTWQTIQGLEHGKEMLSLVVPGEIGIFFIVMFAVQALIGIVAQPFIMSVSTAGRTELDNRVGFMFGNILKRFCTIAWCLTALAAVAWYIQKDADLGEIKSVNVYGDVARAFLPELLPGLLGVFLASMLASVMSSCDSYMISSAALFTENIYKPLNPGKPQKYYVTIGRISGVVVVIGGVIFAYLIRDLVTALKIWFKIAPMIGIAFWMGLLWRRGTSAGAWAATLTGFSVWFLTTTQFFINLIKSLPFSNELHFIFQAENSNPVIYEPWKIVFYTVSATLAGITVSLLTKRVDREKLDRFYNLTRTPIRSDEQIEEPCTLPKGCTPQKRRMLLTAFDLEIPMPSKTSILGFIAGWAAVVLLIGGFILIVSR